MTTGSPQAARAAASVRTRSSGRWKEPYPQRPTTSSARIVDGISGPAGASAAGAGPADWLLAQLPSARPPNVKAHAAAAAANQRSLRSHPPIGILLKRFMAWTDTFRPSRISGCWQPRRLSVLLPDLAARVTESDPEGQGDADAAFYLPVLSSLLAQFISHPPPRP